jgi:hypothetical protein
MRRHFYRWATDKGRSANSTLPPWTRSSLHDPCRPGMCLNQTRSIAESAANAVQFYDTGVDGRSAAVVQRTSKLMAY